MDTNSDPTSQDPAPQDITEEQAAARHAGWNTADGPAPYEHAPEPADAVVPDAVMPEPGVTG